MSEKTKSETAFERFLLINGIPFRPLSAVNQKTPDYEVIIGDNELIFEIKELAPDPGFQQEPVHSGTVGEQVRKRIKHASKQVQFASNNGKPTILLIFNNRDLLQLFGTENHDFEHAMYGELTSRSTRTPARSWTAFTARINLFSPTRTRRLVLWGGSRRSGARSV